MRLFVSYLFGWNPPKSLSPKTLQRHVQETKIFARQLYLTYCSSTVKENFQQKVSRIVLLCQAHCYSSSSSGILYNFSILLMTVPSTSSKSLASELPNSIFVTQDRGKSKFVSISRSILAFNIWRLSKNLVNLCSKLILKASLFDFKILCLQC